MVIVAVTRKTDFMQNEYSRPKELKSKKKSKSNVCPS